MSSKLNYISIYHFKKKMCGWYINNVMSIILQDMMKIAILEDKKKYIPYDRFSELPEDIKSKLIVLKSKELKHENYKENKKYWDMVYIDTCEVDKFSELSNNNKSDSTRTLNMLKALLYIISEKHYDYDVNKRNTAVSKIAKTCELKGYKIANNTLTKYLQEGHEVVRGRNDNN